MRKKLLRLQNQIQKILYSRWLKSQIYRIKKRNPINSNKNNPQIFKIKNLLKLSKIIIKSHRMIKIVNNTPNKTKKKANRILLNQLIRNKNKILKMKYKMMFKMK